MDTIQHNPARLYNCDETGITIVQHKHAKILGLKSRRQISSLQSAERDLLWQSSPLRIKLATLFLRYVYFQEKNTKQELMNGTPHGSIHTCHPLRWIQSEIFTQWFLHFTKYTQPKKKEPVVLVQDVHYSHTRNLEIFTLARENHVGIICLPPHSSHKMQPSDKTSMGHLKTFYYQ
jgi:hypothetical protein